MIFKRKTAFALIFISIFLFTAPAFAANPYAGFASGKKSLGFKPSGKFNKEIYWYIKNKYPTQVSDKSLFEGARNELGLLLSASGIDAESVTSIPADSEILKNFIKKYKGKVSQSLAVYASAEGMVKSLRDPECEIILPSVSKNPRRDMIPEGYGGLGILIEERKGVVTVIHAFDGGSGAKSGLKPGDRILAIDGSPTSKMDLDTAMNRLRGKVGTSVSLSISRKNAKITKKISRENVELNPVSAGISKNGVGYIKIIYFGENYPQNVASAISLFKSKGVKKWILDLRDNAGGALNDYIAMASLFIPSKEPVMIVKYRGSEKEYKSAGRKSLHPPAAVIVNNYTTGSAETLAAILREKKGARLYGTTTRGNTAVAEFLKLTGGATFKMTVGTMTTGSRVKIHKNGIKPDVRIPEADDPANEDSAMNKVLGNL